VSFKARFAVVFVVMMVLGLAGGFSSDAVASCEGEECWKCAAQTCTSAPTPGSCQCTQITNGCIGWGGSCIIIV
jgi:hypothetical protein